MTCATCFAKLGGVAASLLMLAGCAAPPTTLPAPAPTFTVTLQRWRTATSRPSATLPATPRIIASLTPTPTPPTYVVRRGDTLLSIALRLGVTLEALQAANPAVNPQFLSIGTALLIPTGDGTPPPNLGPALAATPLPLTVSAPRCVPQASGVTACWAEVHNPTADPVTQVVVRFTLANAEGWPLTSQEASAALETLLPGQTTPVGVLVRVAEPVRAAQAEVVRALPGTAPTTTLAVLEPRLLADSTGWRLAGQVHHTAGDGAVGVRLTLIIYTQAGDVGGFWQFDLAEPLAPGAIRPFAWPVGALAARTDQPARYTVLAEPLP